MRVLRKIVHYLGSQKGQKTILTLFIVGIGLFATTFAQNAEATTQGSEILRTTQIFLDKIIQFVGRAWILLAALAGKFMTNDLVYGSWLHLDAYLRKLWNISKNLANFGLLAILFRDVFQYITKKSGNMQKTVTRAVVAGILIQSSRFLIGVLMDISTIATAAVGSFPANFIDSSAVSKNTIEKQMAANMKSYSLKFDKEGKVSMLKNNISSGMTLNEFINFIMPKADIISGPLVYIGATTLKIQDSLHTDQETSPQFQKVVTGSALQVLMILMYCATLILLLIANIIRVGLLWMIIPLSPILVLLFATEKKGAEKINKNFSVATILDLIFKPVVFTAVLSLILIFIVSMQNIMSTGSNGSYSIQGTTFTTKGSVATMNINGLATVNINDTVFEDASNVGKNIFSNIIMYFATIFLLRYLIKTAVTSGSGTIKDVMEKSTNMMQRMASTVPIVGGYSGRAMLEGGKDIMRNVSSKAGIDLNVGTGNEGRIKNERYEKWLNDKLGGRTPRTTQDDSNLQLAKNFDIFVGTTNEILSKKQLSYKGDHGTFNKREGYFNKNLQKTERGTNEFTMNKGLYFTNGANLKNDELKLENLNKEGFAKLHGLLGGDEKPPKDYTEFKEKTYGKQESK